MSKPAAAKSAKPVARKCFVCEKTLRSTFFSAQAGLPEMCIVCGGRVHGLVLAAVEPFRAALASVEAAIEPFRTALLSVEFSVDFEMDGETVSICPSCCARRDEGHDDVCPVGRALGRKPDEPVPL